MIKVNFEQIGVGTTLKDLCGNMMMVVERQEDHAILKYIHEDGELSRGSVFAVPSHFNDWTIVNLRVR